MESYTEQTQSTAGITPAEEEHRGKATTAMVLAIIGLALLLLPGLNIPGLVLSIIGLCMAVKNRRFAAANGFKENGNNNAAFICGLIGVIVNGILCVIIILAICLFLALSVTAVSALGPSIGDAITESLPAMQDAVESALPTVESVITGLFGLL